MNQHQAEQSNFAFGKELSAKLDSEILALGGYKKLVIARWGRVNVAKRQIFTTDAIEKFRFERVRALAWSGSIGMTEYTSSRTRYLILIRAEGSLLFWGLYKPEAPDQVFRSRPHSDETDLFSLRYNQHLLSGQDRAVAEIMLRTSRLEPVYLDAPVDNILDHWKEFGQPLRIDFASTILELQEPMASMEIYACLDERTNTQKLPPTRKGKTWDCSIFLRPSADPSRGYRPLDLNFNGRFFVFVKESQEEVQASPSLRVATQTALRVFSVFKEKFFQAGTWIRKLLIG